MSRPVWILGFLLCALPAQGAEPGGPSMHSWPTWRGPLGTGVAPHGSPPLSWSEETGLRWKVEVPGLGHATPITWEGRIFLLSAVPTGRKGEPAGGERSGGEDGGWTPPSRETGEVHAFEAICLDQATGKTLWRRSLREELPRHATHEAGSWASCSPVTDGKRLHVSFGSHGLYCLDLEGEVLWERDLGPMDKRRHFGDGSSPALYGETLVLQRDHEGPSEVVALDAATGKDRWRQPRDEITSWATPLIVESAGHTQVITSASRRVQGYDLTSGKVLWECGGLTQNVIPSPILTPDGLVIVASGFRGYALLAIRLAAARGDITGTDAVAWTLDEQTPYTPSPLLHDGLLYLLRGNSGVISCHDAATGKTHYQKQRLEGIGTVYASPVAAGDRLYVAGLDGKVFVLRHGTSFEVLATCELEDRFTASPAIVGEALLLRGHRHLYCIAGE